MSSMPRLALSALLLAAAGCAPPSDGSGLPASFDTSQARPVADDQGAPMGSVALGVSCGEDAATRIRRGLALLHNMTYAEAESVFRAAADVEPGCAMAYWGVAMTFLHPLWPDVPTPSQLEQGWELLQEARSRGLGTDREEAYVTALEAYYRDAAARSETERLSAYSDAWRAAWSEEPGDAEAALFSALALIATGPGAPDALERQLEAGEIAEAVLGSIPDHPGAHHYVIHAYDSPPLADRALPVARRYGNVAPENSHALHMTSHIFTRRGLWEESVAYNLRAEAAAGSLDGAAVAANALHAIDYLVYAHLQQGRDDLASEILERMRGFDGAIEDHAASVYAFAAVEARIALERRDWAAAAAVAIRHPSGIAWDRYPHLEAIQVFAAALGATHVGDLEAARHSTERLAQLARAAGEVPGAYDWGTQVRVQELGARAWLVLAEGRESEAVALMNEAASVEAETQKNPVTPSEVLPAGELLGDMLLELGRFAEALAVYNEALGRNWNRFNSFYGAALAAEALGNESLAADYYRHLLNMASPSATRGAPLERARTAVSGG